MAGVLFFGMRDANFPTMTERSSVHDHACTAGAAANAPQASRSDRKHCLRHNEVIARLLSVKGHTLVRPFIVYRVVGFFAWGSP